MKIFENSEKDSAFLLNENLKLKNYKCYLEYIYEPLLIGNINKTSEEEIFKEEFNKLRNFDYKKIFYNHPTQMNNLNNNFKLKENKEGMENLNLINNEDIKNKIPMEQVDKEENEMQLLNKKRKQSDGLSELKRDLLEK